MRGLGPLAAALAVAGCATSSVTLLPGEGEAGGAVAVLAADGRETVIDRPMSEGTLGQRPRVRDVRTVRPAHAALLAELPRAPSRFTLNFVQGTTDLTPGSRPVLDRIRAELAARPGAAIEVVGHTDTVGSDEDNDRLSERRAAEVVRALVREGFDEELLFAVGRGERELAVRTGDNVANAANRRVEVVVR